MSASSLAGAFCPCGSFTGRQSLKVTRTALHDMVMALQEGLMNGRRADSTSLIERIDTGKLSLTLALASGGKRAVLW